MGLKKDLTVLGKFSDNPYDADYRPEKEMRRLFIGLMITLPIFLGFFCQFYILASGPLFIYWIITFVTARRFWKDLGWKMCWYYLPAAAMAVLGLYFAFNTTLIRFIGWLINKFMFYV